MNLRASDHSRGASDRTFRLFVSSTFGDFVVERNALQERVFPNLRALCTSRGFRLQVTDLRWGVSELASREHDTMDVCLGEIARAQASGLMPYLLAMLGERYGWRPLPARVPAKVFNNICAAVPQRAARLLRRHYRLDRNSRPQSCNLQPAGPDWNDVEPALRAAFDDAVANGAVPARDQWRFVASATEQELVLGALSGPRAPGSMVAVLRSVGGPAVESAQGASSPEPACSDRLRRLRERVRRRAGENAISLVARWSAAGPDPSYVDQVVMQVEAKLRKLMLDQISAPGPVSVVEQEREIHQAFAAERGALLLGRADVMEKITSGLEAANPRPFVLMGSPGSGKSAVMARLSTALQESGSARTVLVRFCGLTPASTTVTPLLESLCREIADRFGFEAMKQKLLDGVKGDGREVREKRASIEAEFAIPTEPAALARTLRAFCARIPRNCPLVLVIDAIDQLTGAEASASSAWLPLELPDHVRLVVSVATDADAARYGQLLRVGDRIDLPALPASAAADALHTWLAAAGRTLQPAQRTAVLMAARASGTPLHLRLLTEKAKGWPSWHRVQGLPSSTDQTIRELLDELGDDARHGRTLVTRTLALIAAGRRGLTEDELADVLGQDRHVMAEFRRRSPESPPVGALPPIVLSRLLADLLPYLTTGQADGAPVMRFFHRQFAQVITRDLLHGRAARQRHLALARHFARPPSVIGPDEVRAPDRRSISELPFQLAGSGRWNELQATLSDAPFLAAKVAVDGPVSALDDFELAKSDLVPDASALSEIAAAIRLSITALAKRPHEIACQLAGRLRESQNAVVIRLIAELEGRDKRPALRPLRASWWSVTEPLQRTIATGSGEIVAGTVVGERIIAATKSGAVQVWDARTGIEQLRISHPAKELHAAAFATDGSFAVTSGSDNTLRVWDLATGAEQACIDVGSRDRIDRLQLSPDQKRVLSVTFRTVSVWSLMSEPPATPQVLPEYAHRIDEAIETFDGLVVAGAYDGSLVVFKRRALPEWACRVVHAHKEQVPRLTLLGNGSVVSAGRDGLIKVWNRDVRKTLLRLRWERGTYPMALLAVPGTDELVVGSSTGRVDVWSLQSAKPVLGFAAHKHWVTSVGRTADGGRLVTMSADGTARVWDRSRLVASARAKDADRHQDYVSRLAVTRDGKLAVSASADRSLIVWATDSGRALRQLKGHEGWIQDLALFADGRRAVSTSSDGTLRVWDILRGTQLCRLDHHNDPLEGVAITPDQKTVLTAYRVEDGQDTIYGVHHWDVGTWKWTALQMDEPEKKEASFSMAGTLAVSNDGQLALAAEPYVSNWSVWRLADRQMLHRQLSCSERVASAIPIGNTEILVGLDNGAVERCDMSIGRRVTVLVPRTGGGGKGLGVTADGRFIVTDADDHGVAVWDARTGTQVARVTADSAVTACAITPDGAIVMAGDESGRVYTMRLAS